MYATNKYVISMYMEGLAQLLAAHQPVVLVAHALDLK